MLQDKLSPSMMCASFFELAAQTATFEKNGIELLHIDVMDGAFVPNITFGAPVVKSFRKYTDITFDVHLMINDPIRFIDDFVDAYYENNIDEIIEKIKNKESTDVEWDV